MLPPPLRHLLILAFLAGSALARPTAGAGHAYRGAIVIDAATGAVLFEDNADEVSPPASMAKLMTYAVLDDRIRAGALGLDTPITVTAADGQVAMRRDSTSVWLKAGEVFPTEELIYAMLIRSANDAAYTLAGASAGTVEQFVWMMNAKAAALGMTHTRFRTPNGLPPLGHRSDTDLTTPRDFSKLCRYLVLHTNVLKYTSVRTRKFGVGHRFPPVDMSNFNYLLGKVAGVDGLKSGFTDGARFCLSTTAERRGRRVIVVVMGSPDWRSVDGASAQLIERAFATAPITPPSSILSSPPSAPSAPMRPNPTPGDPIIKFVPAQ